MAFISNNFLVPSLIHQLKTSIKQYKLFLSFYGQYIDTDSISGLVLTKDETYKYNRLLENRSYNRLNVYFSQSDSIEILYDGTSIDYDIIRTNNSVTSYYKILSDTNMFYDISNSETTYYLYIKKIVNWSVIPFEQIHQNPLTYDLVYLCYTPDIVIDNIKLPNRGSLLGIQVETTTKTINFDSVLSNLYEFFIKLSSI